MDDVSPIKNGGSSNPMEKPACTLAYSMWPRHLGDRFGKKPVIAIESSSTAFVFAIVHWTISLL